MKCGCQHLNSKVTRSDTSRSNFIDLYAHLTDKCGRGLDSSAITLKDQLLLQIGINGSYKRMI